MNKRILLIIVFGIIAGLSPLSITASADEVMTKLPDGTYVVNTTELCKARGYKSFTPVEVHIKSGKVISVQALPNRETPKYFKIVKTKYIPKFEGLKFSKAQKLADDDVDGCTGATMSAKAVQQNIKMALDYYNKNK